MKKTIGILLIIIGVLLIIGGVSALNQIDSRNDSFAGRFKSAFSERYRSDTEEQQQMAAISIGVGVVLLIIGIVLTVSGTKKQVNRVRYDTPVTDYYKEVDVLTDKALAHYQKGEYSTGVVLLERALKISPINNRTHYNLACLYSKLENKEAFIHLSKAVEYGYSNFEKIKMDSSLSWLRTQPEYTQFLRNGFTASPLIHSENDDKILEKLERLGKLKEQGVLTEEEFQLQKARIIS